MNEENKNPFNEQDNEMFLLESLLYSMEGKSPSNAILDQEKRGQRNLCHSDALPKECPRIELEALGFAFGADIDDLFVSVTMPQGWHKDATGHSMWSNLIDDKGRIRGSIFYKAAFYDRRAHMALERRFSYKSAYPVNGYSSPDYSESDRVAIVTDCNKEIFRTEATERRNFVVQDMQEKSVRAWLDEHYPDWQNPLAYWE